MKRDRREWSKSGLHFLQRSRQFLRAIEIAVENKPSPLSVKFPFPSRNEDGRHPVADEIGERSHLRHKTINTQQQRNPGNRRRSKGGESSCQGDEPTSRHCGGPFGIE